MTNITLYGPHWSAYTRAVRLTLIEKNLQYRLEEVDFLSGVMPEEQLKRHPFGKVPALLHDDFMLYETAAICRYIDTAFPKPELQPTDAQLLGRMTQIISILDVYLSEPARMGFTDELLIKPLMGLTSDPIQAREAESEIAKAFAALSDCIVANRFLAGNTITLADLHAIPLFDYIDRTPGGSGLISKEPKLHTWWSGIKNRRSVVETQPDMSVFKTAQG